MDGYFFPIGYCGSIFECYCTLMCYSDDQIGYNADPRGCDLPLGLVDKQEASTLGLWPNPGNGHMNYALPVTDPVDVVVVEAMGRMVLEGRSLPATGALDLERLCPGLYFLSFSTNAGYRVTQRWQKVE